MHDVVISIVNYHQPELLERCLEQLETLTLPGSWTTIVVDNESDDDAAAWIRDRYSWVRLIVAKENLGFGGGHNLAYAQSDSRRLQEESGNHHRGGQENPREAHTGDACSHEFGIRA